MPVPPLAALLLLGATPAMASDPFVEALVLDFEQDGVLSDPVRRAGLYAQACAEGVGLACQPGAWHDELGRIDRAATLAVFGPLCDPAGPADPRACLPAAWVQSQDAFGKGFQGGDDPSTARARLTAACESGLARACHEAAIADNKEQAPPALREAAQATFRRLCEDGLANACLMVQSNGSDEEYRRWRGRGCDLGDAVCCKDLAGRLEEGDPGRSALWTRACELGSVEACAEVALVQQRGGGPLWEALAQRLDAGCQDGRADACALLAASYTFSFAGQYDPPRAQAALDRLCLLSDQVTCRDVAEFTSQEESAEENRARQDDLCSSGNQRACLRAGIHRIRGTGGPVDLAGGIQRIRASCDGGYAPACAELGWLYVTGPGLSWDSRAAMALWERACQAEVGKGCRGMGVANLSDDDAFKRRPEVARDYLERACTSGDLEGCRMVAQLHYRGDLGAVDDAAAIDLLTGTCDKGHAPSCVNLGWLLHLGRGGPAQPERAVELFRAACDDGFVGGCARLAVLTLEGQDVGLEEPPDQVLTQACNRRQAAGCVGLGYVYLYGIGRPAQPGYGAALLAKACLDQSNQSCQFGGCEIEDALACRWRAEALDKGLGVSADPKQARRLYDKACALGDTQSCER